VLFILIPVFWLCLLSFFLSLPLPKFPPSSVYYPPWDGEVYGKRWKKLKKSLNSYKMKVGPTPRKENKPNGDNNLTGASCQF
jgi:hypothetical protein